MENVILKEAQYFAEVCGGLQKKFFAQQLKDYKQVECVSVYDVFNDEEILKIKNFVKPKEKECYKNAHLLSILFPEKVKYVEGKVAIFGGTLGIEHAWNKVGDVYVDLTFEMALNKDVTKELYMSLGVYDLDTITQITSETGYYGNVYNQIFIKQNN